MLRLMMGQTKAYCSNYYLSRIIESVFFVLLSPVLFVFFYCPVCVGVLSVSEIAKNSFKIFLNPFFIAFLLLPYFIPYRKWKLYIAFIIFGWAILIGGAWWHIEVLKKTYQGPEVTFILFLGFFHSFIYLATVHFHRYLLNVARNAKFTRDSKVYNE